MFCLLIYTDHVGFCIQFITQLHTHHGFNVHFHSVMSVVKIQKWALVVSEKNTLGENIPNAYIHGLYFIGLLHNCLI